MTEDRFIELLDAYGADPMRWPIEERAEAAAMADSDNPRLQAALRQASALDTQLSMARVPPVSADLMTKLRRAARPSLSARLKALLGWDGALWQPAAALSAALVLGIGLGITNPQQAAALTNITVETPNTAPLEALLDDGESL